VSYPSWTARIPEFPASPFLVLPDLEVSTMKTVRALSLLFALVLLPACGTSPMAPEIQDALLDAGEEPCIQLIVESEKVCRGGYIGSGS